MSLFCYKRLGSNDTYHKLQHINLIRKDWAIFWSIDRSFSIYIFLTFVNQPYLITDFTRKISEFYKNFLLTCCVCLEVMHISFALSFVNSSPITTTRKSSILLNRYSAWPIRDLRLASFLSLERYLYTCFLHMRSDINFSYLFNFLTNLKLSMERSN